MLIELDIVADVYGPPNEEGVPRLIKKNITYKKLFDTTQIKAEEYVNDRGIVAKSFVNIIEGEASYKARHKYSDIVSKLKPLVIKGFLSHGKRSIKN